MPNEELFKTINDRLTAIGEQVSEQRLVAIVKGELDRLTGDEAFVRKMRFGSGAGDKRLAGSKFARWGLSVGDIEFLYDLVQAQAGKNRRTGGVYAGPSEELQNAFSALSEAYYLPMERVRELDKQALDNLFPRITRANEAAYERALRAMDTAESGYGSQLIGAQYVGDLWEGARAESSVFTKLSAFEMTAPTAYLPVEAALPEMTYVSENTSADSTKYTTVKTGSNRVSVSVGKFIIRQQWSGEMEEDSIIPFVPFLRRQLAKALAFYSDSLVLNGDTTDAATGNINLDDADPAATKHYLALDGILHAALVDNTNNKSDLSGAAPTWDNIKGLKKLMLDRTYLHDWGHPTNPDDLLYVCDPEMGDAIDKVDEFRTMDKFGSKAVIANGEVQAIGPHPLVRTVAMSLTEADGKASTTASNNVYGRLLAFNRRGVVVGWRRRIQIETDRVIGADQNEICASLRLGLGRFSPTGAASGIEWAALLYDAAV